MTRVATLALQNMTLFHTLNTQARTQDLQVQLASDMKSQAYSGISGDSKRLISLETQRARVERFLGNITTAEQRIELIDLSVPSFDDG